MDVALGIDIGGTGMKAAPVDVATGRLLGERFRIPTPQPSTPEAMANVVRDLDRHFTDITGGSGPVGVAVTAVVRAGVVHSAAHIDSSWMGADAASAFSAAVGRPVVVVNDADAAGIAEMSFGAGRGRSGLVITLTLGTGIGSGMFMDGVLVPNTEFGHLEFRGESVERYAAASAMEREELDWEDWADRVGEFLDMVDRLFSPDMVILGGGVSREPERWFHRIDTRFETVIAAMANHAGVVGAAMAAV
ncbi:MAG: polyphosphate--glucose phosphotransferase [Ilumatobacteraceae bacterium]